MFSLLFLMIGCAEETADSAFFADPELPEGDRVAVSLVGQDLSADFDAESGVTIVQAPAEATSNTDPTPATHRVRYLNYPDMPVENANTGFLHYVSRESMAVYYLAATDPTGASTLNYGSSGSNITLSYDGNWTYYNLISTLNGVVNGYDIWGSAGTPTYGGATLAVNANAAAPTIGPAGMRNGSYIIPIIDQANYSGCQANNLYIGTLGSQAAPIRLSLNDAGGGCLHGVRLNPVQPNILFYTRANGSLYVVDWELLQRRSTTRSTLVGSISHPTWSPDGLWIGAPYGAQSWKEWRVVKGSQVQTQQIATRQIGTFGTGGMPELFYGSYSEDGTYLVVSTDGADTSSSDEIYVLNRVTGAEARVASAENVLHGSVSTDKLVRAVAHFYDGTNGIMFHSNKGYDSSQQYILEPTQVYLADMSGMAMP